MDTKTYNFVDKSKWPAGPWQSEPDKMQWPDAATGLPCLVVRNWHSGHWCGYVGVTEGHPAYAKGYNDVDVDVHGGLTYADFCMHDPTEHSVCHVPGAGEPDTVYWLGFDCGHSFDLSPSYSKMGTYRTLDYVRAECAALALQLSRYTAPTGSDAPDDASESDLELSQPADRDPGNPFAA